jgi:type IX secretion system PorP/SprF family membrane protein
MKATINKITLVTLVMVGALSNAVGQYEPMFTQYMFNEVFINPAYAGSRENLSVTALRRMQWVGIDGAPTTNTITGHAPIMNQRVGVGLTVMNDVIGVTRQTGFYASGAYRMPVKKGTLSFGLQLGFLSHIERLADVSTEQADDDQFIANTDRVLVPNFGFGTYYKAENWYVGLSIPRMMLNAVNATATETEVSNRVRLGSWHYFLTGGFVKQITPSIKLRPNSMLKVVGGAPLELDITCDALFRDMIWAGLGYRTGDAVSLLLGGFVTPQLRVGYSYDYTTSALRRFNSGSHEIMLGYDFGFKGDKLMTPRFF